MTAMGSSARPSVQRGIARGSWTMAAKHSASIQRRDCWETASQGGTFVGRRRHSAPVRAIQRRALNTTRGSWRRWEAPGLISVKFGTTTAQWSSVTSEG